MDFIDLITHVIPKDASFRFASHQSVVELRRDDSEEERDDATPSRLAVKPPACYYRGTEYRRWLNEARHIVLTCRTTFVTLFLDPCSSVFSVPSVCLALHVVELF